MRKFLNPKTDITFKKIFGSEKYKHLPISFLNSVLELKGDEISLVNTRVRAETKKLTKAIEEKEQALKKCWTNMILYMLKDGKSIEVIKDVFPNFTDKELKQLSIKTFTI